VTRGEILQVGGPKTQSNRAGAVPTESSEPLEYAKLGPARVRYALSKIFAKVGRGVRVSRGEIPRVGRLKTQPNRTGAVSAGSSWPVEYAKLGPARVRCVLSEIFAKIGRGVGVSRCGTSRDSSGRQAQNAAKSHRRGTYRKLRAFRVREAWPGASAIRAE
jgi:hypothetical protein